MLRKSKFDDLNESAKINLIFLPFPIVVNNLVFLSGIPETFSLVGDGYGDLIRRQLLWLDCVIEIGDNDTYFQPTYNLVTST